MLRDSILGVNTNELKIRLLNSIAIFLKLLIVLAAISYVFTYLVAVYHRIQYPFELEWVEGPMLDQVRRVLSGQQLYAPPSIEYVPFLYTPLYFYVSAAVSKITGFNFISLRLVSFISSIGSFFLIFFIVKKETNDIFPGIVAAGLFSATYKLTGNWFDLGRMDSLFLFLLLLALYFVKFGKTIKSQIIAGVFMTLSFLTKQTAALIILPIILANFFIHKRRAIWFMITTAGLITLSSLLINHISDGWFYYYLSLALQHSYNKEVIGIKYLNTFFMSSMPIAWLALVYYLSTEIFKLTKNGLFYVLTATGVIGISFLSKAHEGGATNSLIPAYAMISILFGLTIFNILQSVTTGVKRNERKAFEISIYVVILLQFWLLTYNSSDLIPTNNDVNVGRQTVDMINQIQGEVFIPLHNYLPSLVNKKTYANSIAIWDIFRSKNQEPKSRLQLDITTAIQEKKFNAIILDDQLHGMDYPWFRETLDKYYVQKSELFSNETGYITIQGPRVRPAYLYVSKPD